jgi:WD40 repeat protein/tRNA A-37 threonylcarbamoyl transferase component Bud32
VFVGPAPTEAFVGPASSEGPAATRPAGELPIVARRHYEVLSEHARGGLGRILRARDTRTGRLVAIKEMLGDNDDAARRFAREALITANLQHPAIVPVYELGRWETGEPFYAMKMVSGHSFESVIKECKTLDERLARLPVVVSVAEALAFAHGRRIIHRDLKPANVLVGDLGETVVIDWGLAKSIDDAELAKGSADAYVVPDEIAPLRTIVGAVMGTPSYMPPEATRGDTSDERSDVYQIGALLYHLISGRAPYAERKTTSAKELVKIVTAEPPIPLEQHEPGTPPELVTIVGKAMHREPAERYATAGELTEDLRRFTTGQLVRAHLYDRRTLFTRWLRRNRAPVTVGAVLALALIGVAFWSVESIISKERLVEKQRDKARDESERAEKGLADALYEKGRVAEGMQEWARAAMYYAAARRHFDTPAYHWAAGLAEARAVIPSVRFTGHAAWVHAVAISRDGQRVATVDDAGEVRVWSPRDGHVYAALSIGKHPLYSVAFSPDDRELAIGGDDGVIERRTPDLAPLGRLTGHVGRIWTLAYSPDGSTLASGGEDHTVRLWPRAGGEPRVLTGHTQRVYSVAFSPDGTRLATAADDRHMRVWDLATLASKERGEHRGGGIRVVAFTPEGDALVTSGWDQKIRLWRGNDPIPDEWQEADAVHGAAVSPSGEVLVTVGGMPAIHAWDLSTHRLITTLEAPGGQTSAVAFSRDGHWLVTAGQTAPVAWDASAFRRLAVVGHRAEVVGLAFSRDGSRFISGSFDHTLRLWETATGAEKRRRSTGALACGEGLAVLGSDELVASCDDGTIRRWGASIDPQILPTDGWMRQLSMSPDGATIAAGHAFGHLVLVDVARWQLVTDRKLHAHFIEGVLYGLNGDIVTASLDDHVRVWRGPDLTQVADIKVSTDNGVLAAAISPDGGTVGIGTQEGSIDVWDVRAGSWRVRDLGGGKLGDTVWKTMFSPDGRSMFSASDDGAVRIWDTKTWTSTAVLDAGEGPAMALAVSPDGATVTAGYRSGAIAIWDVAKRVLRERIGGRTRDRGSCTELGAQVWTDESHRKIVANACATDPDSYFSYLSARMHQRLDTEVDVTWDWLGRAQP